MRAGRWDLEEGEELAPGLTALRRLGGGERYEAYLAADAHRFCPVVVKVLRPDQVGESSARRGLAREAETLGRLAHPVLPRLFGVDLDGPRPYVVLEHLEGPRLSSLLRRYGTLAPEQLLPLALEVCAALHYLAGEDVVHLDVKPSNVVMGAPPRLIDLSVARTTAEAAALDSPVGTDAYMAPEQWDPPRTGAPGPASDVWGLGATLYEACTGRPPDAAAPVWDGVPPVLTGPLRACLAPDPDDRPEPATLAHLLEPAVAALPRPVLAGFRPGTR